MIVRRKARDYDLFNLTPPQRGPRSRERPNVYAAIMRARAAGVSVIKAGRGHKIVRPYGHSATIDTATLLRWFPPVD